MAEIPENIENYFRGMGYDVNTMSRKINYGKTMADKLSGFGELPPEVANTIDNLKLNRKDFALWSRRLEENIDMISANEEDREQLMIYADIYKLMALNILESLASKDGYVAPKELIAQFVATQSEYGGEDAIVSISNIIEIDELDENLYSVRIKNADAELPPIFPPIYVYKKEPSFFNKEEKTRVVVNKIDVDMENGFIAERFEKENLPLTLIGFVGVVSVVVGGVLFYNHRKKKDVGENNV